MSKPAFNRDNLALKYETAIEANDILIDDKNCYKTDGLVKLFGLKKLEVLLVETSGYFGNKDKVKLNFDYHKGMFGMLTIHKSIADDYQFASTEKFGKVKVFLNAAGNNRIAFVPKLVKFCWKVKCLLQDSIKAIVDLRDKLWEFRSSDDLPPSLNDSVSPTILKLTIENDSSEMNHLRSFYSPHNQCAYIYINKHAEI
ncbi:unnamed protein product [Rhizopus stolonifer]